jgi:hypothetical protein
MKIDASSAGGGVGVARGGRDDPNPDIDFTPTFAAGSSFGMNLGATELSSSTVAISWSEIATLSSTLSTSVPSSTISSTTTLSSPSPPTTKKMRILIVAKENWLNKCKKYLSLVSLEP